MLLLKIWNLQKKHYFLLIHEYIINARHNLGKKLKKRSPAERPMSDSIFEALYIELESQINNALCLKKEREERDRVEAGVADYSWLKDPQPILSIPKSVHAELVAFSLIIQPDDIPKIILEFRKLIEDDTSESKISALLMYVLQNSVRPKDSCLNIEPLRSKSHISLKSKRLLNGEKQRSTSAPSLRILVKNSKVHPTEEV